MIFCFSVTFVFSEENFILIDAESKESIYETGTELDERVSPCSTFKIALSLMGFDSEILIDAQNPVWYFQEGFTDFLNI